jgi:hypothetical protein
MALVNPNIAMSFRQPEFQAPNALAQYAQIQQIQGGQRQAEVADMQLESLRRDRDVLGRIQAAIVAKGGPPDLAAAADEMIKSGKPEYMTQGAAIRQKLADQAAFAAYQSEFEPKAQNALGASPTGMDLSAGAQAPGDYTSTQTMGRVPGVVTTPIPESPPMNALTPTAAPVNAMAGQPDIAGLEARYRRVANIDTPGAKAEAALLLKQIDRAATATPADIKTMQALGYPINQTGFKQFRDAQREQRLLTPEELQQKLQIANASANRQTMQVNTMLPASEEAQKEFTKEIRQTYGTLKQAPTVLDNIEKAKALVPQAKGFMGAGGESVLQAASFLNNRLGTSIDTKGVTSAEELRSRLFLGIMDNLKKLDSQPSQQQQAALQVALGSIGTDPTALPRVLDVFGETVRQKVDLYNEEVKSAEDRGVKFPYNPVIKLPSRPSTPAPGAAAARPAGVGANWTFERDAAGNTAWVSPDRKSFKEAK